jgi:pimeloyl-ACP methyl ester carboxylesterase
MSKPPILTVPDGVVATTVDIPGGPLAALEAAPGNLPTRTAVLVPGFTGSKEDFVGVLRPLAEAGYRVLAIDQRGQFDSAGPADPAAYTVARLGADLAALVRAVSAEPVHLVGHSFGGLVAREAVIAQPQLAETLTLLGSGPAALGGSRAESTSLLEPVLDAHGMQVLWEASEAVLAQRDPEGAAARPPELVDFLHRRFVASAPDALRGMGRALLSEPDRVDDLRAAYAGPVLVAHGEGDDAWPPALQKEMAARLEAAYAVIPDALHSPAAENPERTVQVLLDFWAGR